MAISEAKLEANRRNCKKSTGPRTEAGKARSKLNGVKHGMRAATLVLLDEDAQELDDRKADWAASLMPRGAAEQRIVDEAVEYTWMRDRARRAQEARIASNIFNHGVDQAKREADEVLRLGQKLFADNRGPLANYPHRDVEEELHPRKTPLVSHSEIVEGDPQDPQRLVLHLQATAGGCRWMLDRWSELKSILSDGLAWQSADKLKASRLLGRHPIEAVDDRNVLMIFVACQTIESRIGIRIPEIWNELRDFERKAYGQRLEGRGIEKLRPRDAAAARQALFDLVERATDQIALKAETHRARAEINDSLAGDRLLFDDSPEAERLRRFDLACGRGMARSLESLVKLRRAPQTTDTIESIATALETGEPTVRGEKTTTEATDDGEIVTTDAMLAANVRLESLTYLKSPEQNSTTEATVDRPNTTIEPTLATDVRLESLTYLKSPEQNSTTEATDDRPNTTTESTLATDVRLESLTYVKAPEQDSTIEQVIDTAAGGSEVGEHYVARGQERPAGTGGRGSGRASSHPAPARPKARPPENESNPPANAMTGLIKDANDSDYHEQFDLYQSVDWVRGALARIEANRKDRTRKLNEECRRAAKSFNAGRRLRPDSHMNGKPADRPKRRAVRIRPRTTGTNATRTFGDSAELVDAGSGQSTRAGPAY